MEMCDETRVALKQPFSFIGKGSQSYAFESKDGKYVIKFFRSRALSDEKVRFLFHACQLVKDRLKEETGVLYIHLDPTSIGLPVLECRDAIGRIHYFPLDKMHFALQKKAEGFCETLLSLRGNPTEMKRRLDEFTLLLKQRVSKGVINKDPSLGRNFGFLEKGAIEIDFGNYLAVRTVGQEEARFMGKLRKWMEKEMPDWVYYIDEELHVSNSL